MEVVLDLLESCPLCAPMVCVSLDGALMEADCPLYLNLSTVATAAAVDVIEVAVVTVVAEAAAAVTAAGVSAVAADASKCFWSADLSGGLATVRTKSKNEKTTEI